MAVIIKEKLIRAKNAIPSSSNTREINDSDAKADEYLLRVTAGPSYDLKTHHVVPVNGPEALAFENKFMFTKVKVRIRDYKGVLYEGGCFTPCEELNISPFRLGLPSGSAPVGPYFSNPVHKDDQYSIGFSFVPKVSIANRDLVWGNDFDHSIADRLPLGFNTAFKIVKNFIDPGLSCDAYAMEPWLYGPPLSSWFILRIGEKNEGKVTLSDIPIVDEKDLLQEGADGSGNEVRERYQLPENSEKRRKYFLDEANRAKFQFEKGRLYQADFYNPYIDFGNFSLKLPGFSLSVIKYINNKSHTLRYVFKNRSTGDLYFCVFFTLLFGQDVKDALRAEEQESQNQQTPRHALVRPIQYQSLLPAIQRPPLSTQHEQLQTPQAEQGAQEGRGKPFEHPP